MSAVKCPVWNNAKIHCDELDRFTKEIARLEKEIKTMSIEKKRMQARINHLEREKKELLDDIKKLR